MADPKQKAIELPDHLTRILPLWQTPQWMEADRWRRVVYNIPAAIICRDTLISDLKASDWEIQAKDPKEKDTLTEDIEYYTDVLNVDMGFGLKGFDFWVEKGGQDFLTVPVGWNNEVVRWPVGSGPLSRPNPKGHVYKIVYLDAATVFPTYDKDLPLGQRIRQDVNHPPVFFRRDEIARTVLTGRPEIERWGYGMAPPEKIYLAITLLYRGDQYYANLLLDTPEAGILDLMDMRKDSAKEWVQSFKTIQEGIDPMKIGVGYEHDKPWNWISFTRPPAEMMFNDAYRIYTQLTHAGYGLTITDTGLGEQQRTLAGSIRDERRSQRSGFSTAREAVRSMINEEILPPYLKFGWVVKDEEGKVQKGRSFLLAAQALKTAKEARFISPLEGQAQLVEDGHITVEVEPPEEIEPMPFGGGFGFGNPQADQIADRVPASEGGRGDITGKAGLGEERIAAVPADSAKFDQLAQVMRDAFAGMLRNADRPRLLRLVKAATRELFPETEKALVALTDGEMPDWTTERLKLLFSEKSEFDDFPDVIKQRDELFDALDELLDSDRWWAIAAETTAGIDLILQLAYSEGATEAANVVQELLYTEGLVDSPDLIGLNFQLKNPETLAQLEAKAAQLVTRVNDGTKTFLKRIITSGVEEGLASPTIAQMIRDGADVEAVLKEAGFSESVVRAAKNEIEHMTELRTNSIVNTEVAKAETDGRVGQWEQMGLTRKAWVHTGPTGPNDPCPVCLANIALGFVPIDFRYETVFGPADTLGPPAHPQVDHCHIVFDENELIGKAGELNVWTGN